MLNFLPGHAAASLASSPPTLTVLSALPLPIPQNNVLMGVASASLPGLLARGGAAWFATKDPAATASAVAAIPHFRTKQGVLDIGRVKMRLEGLQAYGTICALLMNACLRLFSSVDEPEKDDSGRMQMAYDVFLICVIVSVLLGSYTTIVFTMISLYSKQALGRGLDQEFLEFYQATHAFRDSGFRSFIFSLVSFQLAFVLNLVLKLHGHGRRQKIMVGLSILAALVVSWRWTTVMQLAAKFIYHA